VAREPHAPALVGDEVRDLDLREPQAVDHGARVLHQQPAGVGELGAAARAGDERRAHLRLERGQVLRDRGLREREGVGGGGQRTVVGDRAQRAQPPEVVHKRTLSKLRQLCLR
jgi:hypothetical protein